MSENSTRQAEVVEFYNGIKPRGDLAFEDLSRSEINQVTHKYHSYPAKFTPPLIKYLLNNFTNEGDYIWDPFCGSGTLNVEALRNGRNSLGSDINPIAILISKAKTTPLNPGKLSNYKMKLFDHIETYGKKPLNYYLQTGVLNGNYPELKKWYSNDSLLDLSKILLNIRSKQSRKEYQTFALCCFSAILKRTSYWLSASVKPQLDYSKEPSGPVTEFKNQFNRMEKINEVFYAEELNKTVKTELIKHDAAKKLPKKYPICDHIITSPPYLVSYEYSDIFRLSSYLLSKYNNSQYLEFKKKFIGTQLNKENLQLTDRIKKMGITPLNRAMLKNAKMKRIYRYYLDMDKFLKNASNNLNPEGKLILIVGDATVSSEHVPNAFILSKIAENNGFSLSEKYKRKIIGKNLPTYRDKKTGKFVPKDYPNKVKAHAEEYLLIFEKMGQ